MTPTLTLTCERPGCNRTLGPYFDPKQAAAALGEHERWRHDNFVKSLPGSIDNTRPPRSVDKR